MVAPISNFVGFVGIGKETTYGTAVAATQFPPATSIESGVVPNYVADTGMRGSRVTAFGQVKTQSWGTFNYGGNVYLDTIGPALKGILGDETVTGASAPFTHAISTLNTGAQPQSYTLVDYTGFNAQSYAGSVYQSLAFTMDATGLLSYTAQAMGLVPTTVTKPTQAFSAELAMAGYTGVITIAGVATSLVENATLTLSQAVNPQLGINNSTSPNSQFAGAVDLAGSFTAIYEDDTFRTPMLAGTPVTVSIVYTVGGHSLTLLASNVLMTKADVKRGSNGWLEVDVDVAATADTTDAGASGGYSPCKATLLNAVSGPY
jgi:hypothetical protein